ncbi:MAG TPA: response regulator [Pedobacter sp.]|jgi:DNA-binding response OmpR family regulator
MIRRKKVLLIEDDEDIRLILGMILKDDGIDVIESDSLEVISHLETIKPDLILMDNSLRDGSGSEACKKLKNDATTSHFPIILISAAADLSTITKECLADGFIEKPFNLTDFVSILSGFQMFNHARAVV